MDQPAVISVAASGGHGRLPVAAAIDAARLYSLVAVMAGGLAAACGGVLLVRRLSGALLAASPPGAVLGASFGLAILTLVAEAAEGRGATADSRRSGFLSPAWLARLGLLAGLVATAAPPRLAGVGDAASAVAAWGMALAVAFRGDLARLAAARGRGLHVGRWAVARPAPFLAASVAAGALPRAAPADGNVVQRFERFLLPDGSECVRGRLSVVVAAGTRLGSGHLGFCPPLAACPSVEASTDYDAVEAVVSAAEVLPWGVRVECRLDEPAEETIEIPVDLLAKVPA